MDYRFELVTAPAQEPVSLSEAKTHLRYDDSDEDSLILRLIENGRRLIESYTSRQLVTATWKMHMDCFPRGDIQIRKCPVASVSSITYSDTNGSSQTWSSSNYQTDLVSYPARIRPEYNVVYPSTRLGKFNAVTVQFVAGEAVSAVPKQAKQAILIYVGHLFEHRELVGNAAFYELPFAFQALVDSLKWTDYAGAF